MTQAGAGGARVSVYFGGRCDEVWTNTGLAVTYKDRLEVTAVRVGDTFRAEARSSARSGDVKADYNESARSAELASKLNAGQVPQLSAAYFQAAATAAEAFLWMRDTRLLPGLLQRQLGGGLDALILPEVLRLLLDEHGASWESAVELVGRCFTLRPDEGARDARVPAGAIAALQPRDAELIRAVNEKLCGRFWDIWPGDWLRIGANAVLRDEEVDLMTLSAALCGRINCTKERRAGSFRAMYILTPAKFIDI